MFCCVTVVNCTIALQDVHYYVMKYSSKESSKTADPQKYMPWEDLKTKKGKVELLINNNKILEIIETRLLFWNPICSVSYISDFKRNVFTANLKGVLYLWGIKINRHFNEHLCMLRHKNFCIILLWNGNNWLMRVMLHWYTCCVPLRGLWQGTSHGSGLDPHDQHLEPGVSCTEGEGGFHNEVRVGGRHEAPCDTAVSHPFVPLQPPCWGRESRAESRTQPLVLSATGSH